MRRVNEWTNQTPFMVALMVSQRRGTVALVWLHVNSVSF